MKKYTVSTEECTRYTIGGSTHVDTLGTEPTEIAEVDSIEEAASVIAAYIEENPSRVEYAGYRDNIGRIEYESLECWYWDDEEDEAVVIEELSDNTITDEHENAWGYAYSSFRKWLDYENDCFCTIIDCLED